MNKQGFIDFNSRYSTDKSGKASSYARAIEIMDDVLQHQNEIDLGVKSLYDVSNIDVIEDVLQLVNREVKKLKDGEPNIFDYDKQIPQSYLLKNFCSAALNSLIDYSQFETAEKIVAQEKNPLFISKKLLIHFGINKEGEDVVYETKRRRGQDYFRRMILSNYDSRCALTGIDIPELLLASHIIPWSHKNHKKERLNPCNGICLSALYDKAFDKGLITFSPDDFSVIISSALRENESKDYYDQHFGCIIGRKIMLPNVYQPSRDFLAYHQEKVFVGK